MKLEKCKNYQQFKTILQNYEVATTTKYVATKSCKTFSDDKVEIRAGQKLHWQDDIPYFHFGTKTYRCHQGVDTNLCKKKKYAQERDRKALADHSFTKRYNQAQTTKKLGCPATFNVTRVIQMPEYRVPGSETKKKDKNRISRIIKGKILAQEPVGEECYVFNLPKISDHKFHLMGMNAAAKEPVDPRVREKITSLVQRGERNALVIMKLLNVFVENELQETDKHRRRFYPDLKTLRGIISTVKSNLRASVIDQENTEILLKDLSSPDKNIYFRPCTINSPEESGNGDDSVETTTSSLDSHLLFIYQSTEMKHLFRKYGKNSILLDATYKTCKYALPLFFIVVETNVNFQVVGVLITQFETKEAITEGLLIFKNWNADIVPKYGMVDFAMEEILSLEAVYQGIDIFICSFHREQAWNRWLCKSTHKDIPRNKSLSFLRAIANAPTIHDMEAAIKEMKEWSLYNTTPLKSYFEDTWEKELPRWALAHKPEDFYINTNNGVERVNKELKYGYLEGFKGCSLSEIIKVLVESFLPERYRKYVTENLAISPQSRMYDSQLPQYLHGRPKWLIKHIVDRLSLVSEKDKELIAKVAENEFSVQSTLEKSVFYHVKFDFNEKCSCTCPDFRRKRLVCKHIILAGIKEPKYNLESIHEWIFQNPIFGFDETLIHKNTQLLDSTEPTLNDKGINTASKEYGKIKLRGSTKKHLINECNSRFRSLQSISWHLEEDELKNLSSTLKSMIDEYSSHVSERSASGLPMELKVPRKVGSKLYGKLLRHTKKKYQGRVGFTADMFRKCNNGSEESTNDKKRRRSFKNEPALCKRAKTNK